MPLRRFLHLEKQREVAPEPPAGLIQAQRFEGAPSPEPGTRAVESSGAETRRFAEERPGSRAPNDEPPLRLREDDGGLAFIRCGRCRFDHPIGAVRCEFCEADLTTAMQRSYNLALRERLLSEREDERQQLERMDRARLQAQQACRETEPTWWSPNRGDCAEPNWLQRRFDALGRGIGVWLAQRVPNRRWRHRMVMGLAVAWLLALFAAPGVTSGLTFTAIGVGLCLVGVRKP